MGKISERQRWIVLGHDQFGSFGNPARGGDCGCWSPELKQRKRTQTLRQPFAQLSWHSIAVRKLAAVRLVDRPRRGTHVVAGRHVVPPEHVGAGEAAIALLAGLPDLLSADKPIRLTPQ